MRHSRDVQERWAAVKAHLFPHRSSKSSRPSLQALTLTAGRGTWWAAARPDTMIKNGWRCEAERQPGAGVALWRRKEGKQGEQLPSLDVVLIDGLLIIDSKQSVLSDKLGGFARWMISSWGLCAALVSRKRTHCSWWWMGTSYPKSRKYTRPTYISMNGKQMVVWGVRVGERRICYALNHPGMCRPVSLFWERVWHLLLDYL